RAGFPSGRTPVSPSFRTGPANDERRQHRGDAECSARRARRGGASRRLRVVLLGVRTTGLAAAVREGKAGPDFALRRGQARGGAILRQLQPRIPTRDRRASLLQRLWTAPGSEVGVRRGRAAVSDGDRGRTTRPGLRGWGGNRRSISAKGSAARPKRSADPKSEGPATARSIEPSSLLPLSLRCRLA